MTLPFIPRPFHLKSRLPSEKENLVRRTTTENAFFFCLLDFLIPLNTFLLRTFYVRINDKYLIHFFLSLSLSIFSSPLLTSLLFIFVRLGVGER